MRRSSSSAVSAARVAARAASAASGGREVRAAPGRGLMETGCRVSDMAGDPTAGPDRHPNGTARLARPAPPRPPGCCVGERHRRFCTESAVTPQNVPVSESLLGLNPHLHVSYSIPYGNMWASCYFAMTGFHALHVLGGLVIFAIMLMMAAVGKFGPQHENMVRTE
jgi:hypothetical protein